jgi:hypothetical protein
MAFLDACTSPHTPSPATAAGDEAPRPCTAPHGLPDAGAV